MDKCEIIKDLLPLYVDNVCSNSSREMVEEHIETCDDCRAELAKGKSEIKLSFTGVEKAKVKTLQNFKHKILMKNVTIAVVSCLVVAGLALGAYAYAFGYDRAIPYKEGAIEAVVHKTKTIIVDDHYVVITDVNDERLSSAVTREVLDITYPADDFYKSYSTDRVVDRNGEKVKVVYFYLTDTLATRKSQKQNDGESYYRIVEPQMGEKVDRTEVYYVIADYSIFSRMSDKEFDNYRTNGNLIWSGTLE
jgi:hypothetical protein